LGIAFWEPGLLAVPVLAASAAYTVSESFLGNKGFTEN